MRKTVFYFMILFVTITFIRGFCEDTVPTYKGFPVYPPQEIKNIDPKDDKSFSLSLRTRDKTWKKVKDAKGLKFSSVKDIVAIMNSELFKDMRKENNQAYSYINKYALDLGWKPATLKDEPCFTYAKIGKNLTLVIISLGKLDYDGIGYSDSNTKGWDREELTLNEDRSGKVFYIFEEEPLPLVYEGFPLWHYPADIKDYELIKVKDTSILKLCFACGAKLPNTNDGAIDAPDYKRIPEVYGWKEIVYEEGPDHGFTFEKDGKIVIINVGFNNTYILIGPKKQTMEIYEDHLQEYGCSCAVSDKIKGDNNVTLLNCR